MSPKKVKRRSTSAGKKTLGGSETFTDEERDAMRERARERRAEARGGSAAGEAAVRAKLAEMHGEERVLGERLHALVRAAAPTLVPRTWYGMPAYAQDGKVVCFFQSAQRFKTRYATLGFSDQARLDDGAMWPTSFALKELTPAVEARIRDLLERATS